MKSKNKYPCPMCECDKTRTLSNQSAVEIHEFLDAITANFLSRYGQRITRHYKKLAKRSLDEPWWRESDEPF